MYISKRWWFSALALITTLSILTALRAEDAVTNPPTSASADGIKKHSTSDRLEAARARRDAWIKEIGVSDGQVTKIREALKEQADKGRELRTDNALSNEDRRAKMKAIRETVTGKLKEIMTPDQFAKYEKLLEHRRDQISRGESRRPQSGGTKAEAAK